MHLTFAHKKPSAGHRMIASLAAALVLALTVFAASPILHGWLHSFEGPGPEHSHAPAAPGHPAVPDADDDCAVVLFAQGVLAACIIFFFGVFAGRVARFALISPPRLVSKAPEYWVPPLCGPPLV